MFSITASLCMNRHDLVESKRVYNISYKQKHEKSKF
jgi:hypothetical protein